MSDDIEIKEEVEEGAPDWVVTFGDLMSLLLCFFVLLLSFSETDKAIYKEVAGSMANAFGIQRKTIAFNSPKGDKIIARDFDQEAVALEIADKLKKQIESIFVSSNELVKVEVGDGEVSVKLMGESTFFSGEAKIRAQMIPLLRKISSVLKKTKGDIIIAGHTDNVPIQGGAYKSNLRLSAARAASVAEFLIDRQGLDPARISTVGFGKYRPIAANNTPAGRQKNRRVEISLSLKSEPDFIGLSEQ